MQRNLSWARRPRAVLSTTAILTAFACSDGNDASKSRDPSLDDADELQSSDPSTEPHCVGAGQSCAHADCCEGRCQDSVCLALDAPHCAASGQDCSHDDCCEGSCEDSVCIASSAQSCAATGEACTSRDCCAGTCSQGTCVEHASCVPPGGDCSSRDCCEGRCSGSICG